MSAQMCVAEDRSGLAALLGSVLGVVDRAANARLAWLESASGRPAGGLGATDPGEPAPAPPTGGDGNADRFGLLSALTGLPRAGAGAIETASVGDITSEDLAAARAVGATVRTVVFGRCVRVERRPGYERTIEAFAGPVWLPASHPLAAAGPSRLGVVVTLPGWGEVFFGGSSVSGASEGVKAWVDEVTRSVRGRLSADWVRAAERAGGDVPVRIRSPLTPWVLRLTFPGIAPPDDAAVALAAGHGLAVDGVTGSAVGDGRSRWLHASACSREEIARAAASIRRTHRIAATPTRHLAPAGWSGVRP